MDYEQIFDLSFERCLNSKEPHSFFKCFYERFLAADPRVAQAFRNTDMAKQETMLEKSLYRLLVFYTTNSSDDYIETIAVRHNRQHLDITPDLYDLWLEKLLATVAEFDPLFDDNIELAWKLVLAPGITYMKHKYAH